MTANALDVQQVLTVADVGRDDINGLAARYGLAVEWLPAGSSITGSFWGDPEAGIVGCRVFVRDDTPVHSFLHELSHVVCMSDKRRATLIRDAGGDDLEEAAVCYLQVLLSETLPKIGADRLMADMDAWGYSFRLGSTALWFAGDADDARLWLERAGLISAQGVPIFQLRRD